MSLFDIATHLLAVLCLIETEQFKLWRILVVHMVVIPHKFVVANSQRALQCDAIREVPHHGITHRTIRLEHERRIRRIC